MFRDQLCFKHKLPLRYRIKNSTSQNKALIKVRVNGFSKGGDGVINKTTKKIGSEFLVVGIVVITFSLIIFMSRITNCHYLHDECETRIIHCDIKLQNILMDESWRAKISNFRLLKLLKPDQTRTYTVLRGTRGYTTPEWRSNNNPITVKSDVYSLGVFLLETVCCRNNMDESETLRDEEVVLIDWAYQCYEAGEVQNLVIEGDRVDMEELEKMVKIGLWCVETEFSLRPTIKQVILMMEGFVATSPPPSPYSSIRG